MPGGNTRSVLFYEPFPLVMTRGRGCRLWDADDHEYVDFLGEYSAGLYGHSDPLIAAAIREALEAGLSFAAHNVLEAELARLICQRFASVELIRFTNSGTEANLLAVALARIYTGRQRILVFAAGYHGGLLTFGGGQSAPLNAPYDFVIAPYNDSDATRELIRANAGDLAAVLVEPMQGAGGCIPADQEFLAMLRAETTDCGALLIFDEVITSRLSWGGVQAIMGITPDLTTMGKYLGGGLTFGAFGGRADIMNLFDPRRHGALMHAGTFNNNTMTMAAGVAGLTHRFTPETAEALNQRGDQLRERLNQVFDTAGVAMQVTGMGSIMNLHASDRRLCNAADLADAVPAARELAFFDLIEQGIYLANRGLMTLSLPMTDDDCDTLVAAVEDFIGRRHAVLPARRRSAAA
jgi:glutamate-1-semialdehyde 2,1-aminomutase